MINDNIPSNYNAVWQIIGHQNYQIDRNNVLVNTKSGKIMQRKVKGYSVGYNIKGKFRTLKWIKSNCEKKVQIHCPF